MNVCVAIVFSTVWFLHQYSNININASIYNVMYFPVMPYFITIDIDHVMYVVGLSIHQTGAYNSGKSELSIFVPLRHTGDK